MQFSAVCDARATNLDLAPKDYEIIYRIRNITCRRFSGQPLKPLKKQGCSNVTGWPEGGNQTLISGLNAQVLRFSGFSKFPGTRRPTITSKHT
ncbi:hypothetical protein VTI28DRAFT_4950 [Corynascus sepedonium]